MTAQPVPSSPLDGFSVSLTDLASVGSGLQRPECVLATRSGELYVSDARGGVTRIAPDGTTTLYTARTAEVESLAANGFAMLPDGAFLVAPLGGGGVFRLDRDGQAEPFLQEVDGRPLSRPNFVLLDSAERIWICCLTQQDRKPLSRYPRDVRDGYVVLVDQRGARIVADEIGYPNEVRVDPAGGYLYTNETMGGRLLRYPIRSDASLGDPETIVELDESNILDGFTLDSAGAVWMTAIVSNRLWHVTPGGEARVLIEDSQPERLERIAQMQRGAGVLRTAIYEDDGSTLRNISSVAFGGPDLKTVFMGSLLGDSVVYFRSPVAGMRPAHWNFGPY
jgi:sugar lactone lactonase YvrE